MATLSEYHKHSAISSNATATVRPVAYNRTNDEATYRELNGTKDTVRATIPSGYPHDPIFQDANR